MSRSATEFDVGGVESSPDSSSHSSSRGLFGPRPTVGAGAAAKAVAEDASNLVRAELQLAKAELAHGAKAKATGLGLLAGAGVAGWLGLQGLLITLGLVLALVLPLWAAALIVSGVLLVTAMALALAGKQKLAVPVSLDTVRDSVEEDVAWTRAHLPGR